MHLLHPSFHEHIENDTHDQYHLHADLGEKLMVDYHLSCPLCEFFTVNQFVLLSFKPSCAGNQHHDQIRSTNLLMVIKSYSNHIEPRASPYPSIV